MPALVTVLLGALGPVLDRLIPDPNARNAFSLQLISALQSADLSQLKVNEAEASNPNLFVSGWRPFIGWICGGALFYQYIFLPIGMYAVSFFSPSGVTALLNAPKLDDNLWQLMIGMLGMGALRSFEKVKGVAAK
jgi:hypothetical protein